MSDIEWAMVIQWVAENASRYWFADKGPLCPPDQGGADVVVVSPIWCPLKHIKMASSA